MADETKPIEQKSTEDPKQTTDEERRVPESALRKQAEDFARKQAELEKQLQAFKDAQEKADKAKMEQEGKFKELAEAEKARADKLAQEFAAKERRLILEAKLAGIQNEFTREGAIGRCPADMKPEDYVAQLQKDNPELFEPPKIAGGPVTAQSGRTGGSQGENWEQVEADMWSGDLAKVQPAKKKFLDYTAKHNDYPPGWKRRSQ